MKPSQKYLPLKQFHIVKINSLEPKAIKLSAKQLKRDREKIPHTTILNAIVNLLGMEGGFAEYKKEFTLKIKPFMEKHGLKKQADLCTPRNKGAATPIPDISPQNLSERIFFSELNIPKKVFTGYNFNYKDSISDGHFIVNGSPALPCSFGIMQNCSEEAIQNNIKLVKESPNKLIPVNDNDSRRLIDVVAGGFMFQYNHTFNLIGDSLVQPANTAPVVELYNENGYKVEEFVENIKCQKLMFSIFRQRIEESDMGWVDIIPFNKNLVFLRGLNGEYDFIFKNQRDLQYEHKMFNGSLKIADIPRYIDDYHFSRWEYFEHCGWREKESHEAEILFYKQGGKVANYPGFDVVRKSYYAENKLYSKKNQPKSNRLETNFAHTVVNNSHLAISNLISIADFELFAKENRDYMNNRVGEKFLPNNAEKDITLPVTTTFYDALIYSKWLQEKTGLAVRLLRLSEYITLREVLKDAIKTNEPLNQDDLIYLNDKGIPYENHPPYMDSKSFDNLICKFNSSIKKVVLDNGLSFYPSSHFAEWLMEKTCIRSGNLKSFDNDRYVQRSMPPLDGTGKYKHLKTGFRLCYDLDC